VAWNVVIAGGGFGGAAAARVEGRDSVWAIGDCAAAPDPFRYRGKAAFVNLGRYKAVGRIGRRKFRGFPAWWLARTYHMSQIPGAARKVRAVVDWTVSLPFRRDLSEVGSIGHPHPLRAEVYERGGSHRPLD
jgi:NADH dehydrogenase FAD-containing subunit